MTIPATGTSGTANPVIATDDVAGVQFQVVKLDLGGNGASSPVSGAVPVSGTVSIGVGPFPVTDNGGSLTVDGTVTANAGTGPWPVTDNGGSLTVDNAGTFLVQDSEKVTDRGVFTQGTTKVLPVGYILDETIGTALSENMPAAARINANRSQVGVIEDGATRAQYLSVSAAGAAKVDGSAVTQPVSGAVTANIGTSGSLALDATLTGGTQKTKLVDTGGTNVGSISAAGALKVDGSAVTQPVSGTVTTTPPANASTNLAQIVGTAADVNSGNKSAGTLRVTLATDQVQLTNALKVDGSAVTQPVSGTVTANAGTGNFTVVNGGTFAVQDSQVVADNAAFTDGTTKVQPVGYVFDEVAGTALTENDAAAARIDSKRAQVGVLEDATTRGQRAAVSAAGRLSVDASGVAVPITDNSGSITVDGTVTAAVLTGATDLGKAEDAAHTSGDVGVLALGVRRDADTTPVSADGDYHAPIFDNAGNLKVNIKAGAGSGGTAMVDDAAFTPGTTSITPAGGTYRTTRDTLDDNDGGAIALTQKRAVLVSLEDSTGDSAMDDTNNALRVNVVAGSSGGPSKVDDAAFTVATDSVAPTGFLADEVSPDSVDEGDVGIARMSLNRNVYVQLRDISSERSASVSAANALKVDNSGVTQPVSGTVTTTPPANASTNIAQIVGTAVDVNSGTKSAGTQRVVIATDQPALTNALKVDGSAVTQPVSGTVTANAGTGTFTVSGTVTANAGTGTFTVGGAAAQDAAISGNPVANGGRASSAVPTAMSADGDVVYQWLDRSGGAVINGRDAHDAALDANTNPQLTGGRASAAAPTDVSADGDAVRAWRLRNGASATVITAAGALIGGDAANGLDVDVTRLPALAAGTNNIGDVDVLTLPNVTLAAGTNTNEVVGDVAQDAAIAGNPLSIGLRASTALPTAMSADGDAVYAWANRSGAQVVTVMPPGIVGGWTHWSTSNDNSNTDLGTTIVTVKGSQGVLGGWVVYNPNATVAYVQIFDVSGTVTLGTTRPHMFIPIPATSGANLEMTNGVQFANAIKIAATTTPSGSTGNGTAIPLTLMYA